MATSYLNGLVTGKKVTTAADEAQRLSDVSIRVSSVAITAGPENTDKVYIGGSDLDADTNFGFNKGQGVSLRADTSSRNWIDIMNIYVLAAVSGEGVDFYGVPA